MAYYIDLFSPETYQAFCNSSRNVSGFTLRKRRIAEQIKPGDIFVCYLTRLARWFGLLEVIDGPYIDNTPIFQADSDPYALRFHVKELVWLDFDKSIPMHENDIWTKLSFSRALPVSARGWSWVVKSSLTQLDEQDGAFLRDKILSQSQSLTAYPLSEQDEKKLQTLTVNRVDKVVSVIVPDDTSEETDDRQEPEVQSRESIKIQAKLADIGSRMGMSVWVPRSDRGRVLQEWTTNNQALLERLPLNYDNTTLRTIEQIDVLWLRGRSIVRAFEVEHTTSVYSGILRMADLLALLPNMDIKLHIVAPLVRREKVFQELKRPVFSLLERGPLTESCTYLSYDSIEELATQPHLAHMSDSVLDEFIEDAE
jgi:hypothetical protein